MPVPADASPTAPAAFRRGDLTAAPRELLRDGRFANARVERVHIGGVDWIFKDFSSRAFIVRHTVGRFLLARELRALRRLDGIPGIPDRAFRVDAFAIAARFVPGRTLARLDGALITTPYLVALEGLLQQVHRRGLVHLDTGAGGGHQGPPAGSVASARPGDPLRQARSSTQSNSIVSLTGYYGASVGGKRPRGFDPGGAVTLEGGGAQPSGVNQLVSSQVRVKSAV
jgi:hypothetical protein